jgi:hypothetical protein
VTKLIIQELFYITENFKLTEIDGFSSLISDLFLDCELFEADVVRSYERNI